MTKATVDHAVSRETATIYRGKPLIVTVGPLSASIREKGSRDGAVIVSWDAIYELGMKLKARQERDESF